MKQLKEVDESDFPCESKSQLSQIPLTHRFSPLNLFQVIYHTNAFAEKPSALCLFLNTSLFLFYSLCSRLSSWSQLLLPQQDNLCSSLCACVCVCVCERLKGLDTPITHSIPPECELQPWATRLPSSHRSQTHTRTCWKNPASCSVILHTCGLKRRQFDGFTIRPFLNRRPKYHLCHGYHNAQEAWDAVQSA